MKNIVIRLEEPRDYLIVEEITRDAFWNLYCPGCNEHLIVHNLRNHADFIAELTFVIELVGILKRDKLIADSQAEFEKASSEIDDNDYKAV